MKDSYWKYKEWHQKTHTLYKEIVPINCTDVYHLWDVSFQSAVAIFVYFDYSGLDGIVLIPEEYGLLVHATMSNYRPNTEWWAEIKVGFYKKEGRVDFQIIDKGSSQTFQNLRLTQVTYIS